MPRATPWRFQSSLGPKPECDLGLLCGLGGVPEVSILTRAEARVRRECPQLHSYIHSSFNPHSGRSPSATGSPRWSGGAKGRFNPHSGRSPSATFPSGGGGPTYEDVSILTRAEARVRPAGLGFCGLSGLFQSSLGPKPECDPTGRQRSPWASQRLFQSSLGPKPECDGSRSRELGRAGPVSILTRAEARVRPGRYRRRGAGRPGFNPHSGRSPSATRKRA